MTATTNLRCDKCGEVANGDRVKFWHHLSLTYRDFDSIPARADVNRLDFCSVKCLRDFVEALKLTGSSFAPLI